MPDIGQASPLPAALVIAVVVPLIGGTLRSAPLHAWLLR